MIDGFSIIFPTYNMLPYLKICLESLEKNSVLNNEVCICVDGSTDNTVSWMLNEFNPDIHKLFWRMKAREHKGAYSGWNLAAEQATKEYLFLGEDDFYFCPGWDLALAKWIEELSEDFIVAPSIIEPFCGSYIHYDCGDGPAGKSFEEEKLRTFINSRNIHTYHFQPFSMFAIKRTDWIKINGYDENYDPYPTGTRDLQMKLHQLKPRKWIIVHDAYIYHFKPQNRLFTHAVGNVEATNKLAARNSTIFMQKWGITLPESEKILGVLK